MASESQSKFSIIEGTIETLNDVESSGKESIDTLLVKTIQDSVGLSGFKKDDAQNMEFDTVSVEDASLSCSQPSSSRQIVNIPTLEGLVLEAQKDKTIQDSVGLSGFKKADAQNREFETGWLFTSVEDASLPCCQPSSSRQIVNIDALESLVSKAMKDKAIQGSVGLSGFKKAYAQNMEFDTGCSFTSVEAASLSCCQPSSSIQIVNIDTLEGLVLKAMEDKRIQDSVGLSGFKKEDVQNMEFDTGCSFISVEDASLSSSQPSISRQIVNIDTIEGLVSEAKKSQKELMEAMELIRSLRAKVRCEEVAAQRAKEEAPKGGLEVLSKVEELRKMRARTKEINDMRADEIYEEREFLAIKARQLRCRLAQLSVYTEKAVCMIEQVEKKLKAPRTYIAKREKEAAEEETMKNKENARKLRLVEEALMIK